jgi:hypothetical protein
LDPDHRQPGDAIDRSEIIGPRDDRDAVCQRRIASSFAAASARVQIARDQDPDMEFGNGDKARSLPRAEVPPRSAAARSRRR